MILSRVQIAGLCLPNQNSAPLVTDFNDENLRGSSYDLTVGDEYYIGKQSSANALHTERLKTAQTFSIPPHAVCFILATESINLPSDITAKVSLRMTHIYAGLVLAAQPPLDPNYEGKVILLLHNLSSEAVHVKNGERIATIEFMRVENPVANTSATSSPQQRKVKDLESQLTKPIISSLSKVSHQAKSAVRQVKLLASSFVTIIAILFALVAIPSLGQFSSLSEKLKDQDVKLEGLTKQLDMYKSALSDTKKKNDSLTSTKGLKNPKFPN
jgi:deoxycytidine triphosphate deaminase